MTRLKIGINGFGRIGRSIFKINHQKDVFDVVAINDINPDNHNIAYLLQYDSTYGKFTEKVTDTKNSLIVGRKHVGLHHAKTISDVPWEDYGVDIIVDSSGIKNNLLHLDELKNRVKNVVVTYDPGDIAQTIIFGVNEKDLNAKNNFLISTSICDACGLAPIAKIVESDSYNITSGYVTTLHSWLSYQNLLDGPSKSWSQPGDIFSHYALGRSAPMNMIPKSTSAVMAAEKVIPKLTEKIMSFSFRVPTNAVVSSVLTLVLNKDISEDRLIKKLYTFEKSQQYRIIKNTIEPLTSVDYIGEEYSAIVDHRWTKVTNGNHIRILYWYDNEWGYSSRVVDLISAISKDR